MLEPRNRTNWSHKQPVTAFLNTAAFFIRKLKIAPIIAGWFHFKPSATSICLFHSGLLHVSDTVILFQMKSALKKCLLSLPHVHSRCPQLSNAVSYQESSRESSGIFAIPICLTHFWKNKQHPRCKQESTIIRVFFSPKEMFITCVTSYGQLMKF